MSALKGTTPKHALIAKRVTNAIADEKIKSIKDKESTTEQEEWSDNSKIMR